jgi:repressor LexA
MSDLTQRQRAILDYIKSTHADRGYPPSVREIGEAVGLQSPSSVHAQLGTLVDKGYLKKDPSRPRAIVVRGDTAAAAAASTALPAGTQSVPLVGRIAAGGPILATEEVEDTLTLPDDLVGHGTLFALKVRGDSMTGVGIMDGDTVVIRQQPDANDGEIVAAMVGDDEATVKTLRKRSGKISLQAENPAYDPITDADISVVGKVVSVLRRL